MDQNVGLGLSLTMRTWNNLNGSKVSCEDNDMRDRITNAINQTNKVIPLMRSRRRSRSNGRDMQVGKITNSNKTFLKVDPKGKRVRRRSGMIYKLYIERLGQDRARSLHAMKSRSTDRVV